MARKPRLCVAGMPHHVIQRGNNRQPIFFSKEDYLFFLEILKEAKRKHPCRVYSYCLMTNHFHLLVDPEEAENLSLLMKLVGAKFVHYINRAHGRTGSLWEGRFRCSLVEGGTYFLSCLRYIDMNPVRAGLVENPEDYEWSSYRFRSNGEDYGILDSDPWYKGLGPREQECRQQYRSFCQEVVSGQLEWIREVISKGGIVGSEDFQRRIKLMTGREVVIRAPGRPRGKGK